MYGSKICVLEVLLLLGFFQIYVTECSYVKPARVKRGIFGTFTSTVYKTIEKKHYVPASCIYLEPNLPDCRNVRFLGFPNFTENTFSFYNMGNELNPSSPNKENDIDPNSTTPVIPPTTDIFSFFNMGSKLNPSSPNKENDIDPNSTTPVIPPTTDIRSTSSVNVDGTVYIQGWGEYLGLYRPTVIVTELKIHTTTVRDSRIVVTYAVKGCKPHDLPSNIERCPDDDALELAEILPTSTVRARMEATKMPEKLIVQMPNIIESSKNEHTLEILEHERETRSL